MPPAARITDMHTCPMATGPVPHVGGPVIPPGSSPNIFINGLPAATVGTMATCVGPPDTIIHGSATVFFNGLPAARMGDQTAHGGVIIMGSPNVIIGDAGTGAPGTAGFGAVIAATAAVGPHRAYNPHASVYNKPRTRVAVPAPALSPNLSESSYDGVLVGKNCQPLTTKAKPGDRLTKVQIDTAWQSAYVSHSPCCQAMRASGKSSTKIIYVNGIKTNRAAQCETLQKIADQTCAPVLGVHNSTDGTVADLWQSHQDKNLIDRAQMGKSFATHDGRNPAVDSMTDAITNSVRSNDPTTFYAHSQGGDILSLASYSANAELKASVYSQGVSGVNVVTMASAGQSYPSTLSGQHFLNIQDFVPVSLGLGKNPALDAANTGTNQQVLRFMGAPGSTDPRFLSDQEMSAMQHVYVEDGGERRAFHYEDQSPSTSYTQYHDVNTTYLNALKKKDGGC